MRIEFLLLPLDEEPLHASGGHGSSCLHSHCQTDNQHRCGTNRVDFLGGPEQTRQVFAPPVSQITSPSRIRSVRSTTDRRPLHFRKAAKISPVSEIPLIQDIATAKTSKTQTPLLVQSSSSRPKGTLLLPKPPVDLHRVEQALPSSNATTFPTDEARELARVAEQKRRERFSLAIDKLTDLLPAEYKILPRVDRKTGDPGQDMNRGGKRFQRSFATEDTLEMAVGYIKKLKGEIESSSNRAAIASSKFEEALLNRP